MNNSLRYHSVIDKTILQWHALLEILFNKPITKRENPAKRLDKQIPLTHLEKKKSVGFMRVNHSGEVCAQALYRGHMVLSKNPTIRAMLAQAVEEEIDHLAWCQERVNELGGHVSYLNVFWYINAFFIGFLTGFAGDHLSLGFVEETERQVEIHLANHLRKLPLTDIKSRKILKQIQKDEIKHGEKAKSAGAKSLPHPVKKLMAFHAKVMSTLAYWI
ncbi:2-polyprenyl-3-methyl-6-methoxy-1,4-benzoquinone monooxygenase [Coxiella endosymbiont of Amblyomma nuttalli]|uniref:2-polyprenyl-3-methyl-6-methoxy-1,4-benzoquinone monooxygenase n=1 Tax=Coxiella endosymbiont of Amblyomma nuttalli TaxID=2749996 RepID=UPI001BA57AAF|nr:2-polyprenyl-3-methyl-6-methoxy-1,4-benzoquinone monooxygenase [Coxiella endosymbiont of Amblyomma nuttalli]